MDLDALFGEGAELGDDVIVKAQLRFRVHPPKHPVARDIVDRLVSSYDERLDMICEEVTTVLQHADLRRSARSQPLVLALHNDLNKTNTVYAPGAKGGKWYRDAKGHIRYGEKPQPRGGGKNMDPGQVAPHIEHYRPTPFMGMGGIDRDLVGFLVDRGPRYGFSPPELRFLTSWYGTDNASGALFDAFLDCAGLTREDLKGDITQLRFGSQQLTYEEAVFEFFAAQRALFMGDESDDEEDPDEVWEEMLNDQIKPLLDSVFSKYEQLKSDPKFKEAFASDAGKQRRRFYSKVKSSAKSTKDIATHITSGWNPKKQIAEVIAGMQQLGLFSKESRIEHHARVHDRPHLIGSMSLDDRLLSETGNPLLAEPDKLATLSVSQLMLLYAAAELHRRWDPDTRSYADHAQRDVGPGALGEACFTQIGEKWGGTTALIRRHLDGLVDKLVVELNEMNHVADRKAE